MECHEPLQVRFIEDGSKGVREIYVRLSGFTDGTRVALNGQRIIYSSMEQGMKIIS
jgi:hypothetical protein